MSFIKIFKIKNLDKKAKLEESAEIILNDRLQKIMKEIDKYFKDDSTNNLHRMRISFRRFRYVLEIFYGCLPSKLFKHIYRMTKELQDMIGIARDLDVMEVKIQSTALELKQKVPKYFLEKFKKEKLAARQNIKLELIKFISDKDINKLLF
jgi:CHAD domain-containing protein